MTTRCHFFALSLVLCGIFTLGPAANADIVPYDRTRAIEPASTVDDIGLSFLRMANIKPNFDLLAQKSLAAHQVPEASRMDFLKNETFRLQTKYNSFDPDKDQIVIRAAVKLKFYRKPDKSATLDIYFPSEGIIYFPYYYSDYPIALLAGGIEAFQNIILAPDEAALASSLFSSTNQATLLLELTPLKVDVKNPVKLDNTLQYPMMCSIGYIGLLNEKAQQIWAWETPESAKHVRKRSLSTLGVGMPMVK